MEKVLQIHNNSTFTVLQKLAEDPKLCTLGQNLHQTIQWFIQVFLSSTGCFLIQRSVQAVQVFKPITYYKVSGAFDDFLFMFVVQLQSMID